MTTTPTPREDANPTAAPDTIPIHTLIVGTGDMALGLCRQYRLHTLTDEEEGRGGAHSDVREEDWRSVSSNSKK